MSELDLDRLPTLLTFAEAAEALRVSKMTLRRLVDRGELEVVYVSERAPRVPRSSVVALVSRPAEATRC